MPQLHERSTVAYLRGATGEVTADVHFHDYGLLTERSRRSVRLEHLSKIGSPATCSGVVISLSQVQTEEGQWKGVKNGKALKGEREWRLVVNALIVGVSLAALPSSLMRPYGEETDPVLTVHECARTSHTCYTILFQDSS
jgi:hypothetical protein